MKRTTVFNLLAALLTLACPLMISAAQDIGGLPNTRNMVSTAKNLPADPGAVRPLWEVNAGNHQYSIPVIDRGRIYMACTDAVVDRPGYKPTFGGLVMCVEQATGKLIWRLPMPRYFDGVKPPYHFDQWKCGTCSSPVIEGDRVYIIGSRGEILCLDREGQANGNAGPFTNELAYMNLTNLPEAKLEATDGDIIWKYDLIPELDVVLHDVCGSTLLLHGDYLYACTSNGIDDRHDKVPRPNAPTLIVLDKKTGRLVAKDDEKIGKRLLHCNWSSPTLGNVGSKTLIFFGAGDGFLYALEPAAPAQGDIVQTLKKVWSHDCNPDGYRSKPYSKANRNTPEGPSEIISIPVFHNGRVYVSIGQSPVHGTGQGCLSCVDAATGKKIWSSTLVERTLATVAIADGLLYISDYTGRLYCFDADNGERLWVHPLGNKSWCSSPFVADGKINIGTEASVFWVLKAGRELEVLSKSHLKSEPITPAAADGVLYLPTQTRLLAIPGKT